MKTFKTSIMCILWGGGWGGCDISKVKRGYFITFGPLKGHPRGQSIMFYLPQGHPGANTASVRTFKTLKVFFGT